MGVNKLNSILKDMCEAVGIPPKTNHAGRKTLVQKENGAVYKSGTGQGDGDIGTRVWGLGTWGREMRDLRTSSMGCEDV